MKNYQRDKYKAFRTKSVNTLKNLAKKYGYELPKNIKNVEYFAKRLGNYIENEQFKNYDAGIKSNPEKQVLDSYNRAKRNYLKNIPKEYMDVEATNNYFTRGKQISDSKFNFNASSINLSLHDFKTVDDMKKYFKGWSTDKMLKVMKNEIKQLNNFNVKKEIKRMQDDIKDSIDNKETDSRDRKFLKNELKSMDYFQLLNLQRLIDNFDNVYDSIFENNNEGGGLGDHGLTMTILVKIAKKTNYKEMVN